MFIPFEGAVVFCSAIASLMFAVLLLSASPRRPYTRRMILWGFLSFAAVLCAAADLLLRPEHTWFQITANFLILAGSLPLIAFAYRFPGAWNRTEELRVLLLAGIVLTAAGILPGLHEVWFKRLPTALIQASALIPVTLCAIWSILVLIRRRNLAATRPERKKFDAYGLFILAAGTAQVLEQIYLMRPFPVLVYCAAAAQIAAVILAFRATGIHSREGISLTVKLLFSVVLVVFLIAVGLVRTASLDSDRSFDLHRLQDMKAAATELTHDDAGSVPPDVAYVFVPAGRFLVNRTPFNESQMTQSDSERRESCAKERVFLPLEIFHRCGMSGRVVRRLAGAQQPEDFLVYGYPVKGLQTEVGFKRSSLLEHNHKKASFGIVLITGCAAAMMVVTFLLYERMVFRPIQWLLSGIQRLNKGDLSERIRGGARDEIGYAIRAFNRMSRALRQRTEELQKNNEKLDRDKRILQKFFSRDFLDQVLEEKISHNLGGERLPATILFLDIRNSTAIAERIDPAIFSQFLSEIFTDIMDLVYGNHGSVNKLIGDGLLATFGCPVRTEQPALDAAHCALAIRDYMATFNDVRPDYLEEPVRIGIGIATGVVFAGNTGSVRRMEYTVLGDAVNIASRLESLTKLAGVDIFIDGTTADALKDAARLRRVRLNKVRGKIQEIDIYFLAGLREGAQRTTFTEASPSG